MGIDALGVMSELDEMLRLEVTAANGLAVRSLCSMTAYLMRLVSTVRCGLRAALGLTPNKWDELVKSLIFPGW